ncbi:MAG: ABC transporter ATP-binding protein [Kiritimatiellae bacterium]|nr:ABC transporter ATP-binding protein [Kiritimatiellia bacterium]
MGVKDKSFAGFRRVRFLAATVMSSPAVVFVYSPLLVAQTVAGIAVPFATGRFIDALVGGMAPAGPFVALSALLLARAVLTPCLQRLVLSRARNIELKLQNRVLDAVMEFSPSELSPLANGELVAKLTRDAYAVGGFVSGLYPRLLVAVVTMFAAGSALHSRSPALGLSFMAFIPLAIALFFPFARRFAANSHSVRKRSDGSFSALFDFFHSLPFLRTLDAERRFADPPREALGALKSGNCDMDRLTVTFGTLLGFILVIGEIAVLGVAGAFAAKGTIPVGDVVVYQLLFLAAMQSVQGIVSLLPETASLREGIDSLGEILSHSVPRRGGEKIGTVETIEFRNVTFAYPGAEGGSVVKDFSATFRAGRIYAIVGANGTGKTTLLKLAAASLEPKAGEILVNGMPMKSLDESSFRRNIGIVFQDSLLVTGTIRDNITLRDPVFMDDDVEVAAKQSGFDEVVERLPYGLGTRLGLQGQSLSGGEMQRLAIARALVRNPSVLVLDEVTNHLDAEACASFGKLLRTLAPGRIVLLVSHDVALVNMCDAKILCQIPEKASYIRA